MRTSLPFYIRRTHALPAALAAAGATALLGLLGPALPGPWQPLTELGLLPLMGLVLAGGTGLLAYHFARLTVAPTPWLDAATPAAILPLILIPGIGTAALFVPLGLAIRLARGNPRQRVVALMVQCGALAVALEPLAGPFATCFVTVTMLGTALFFAVNHDQIAANDNPSMERSGVNSRMPQLRVYASTDS
jgi:hypothetical protein